MIYGIRTIYPRGSNKGFNLKFSVGSRVRHNIHDEGQKAYRPKRCEYNNEDKDNCPNILCDKKKYKIMFRNF